MTKIGMTGSRRGMTKVQKDWFAEFAKTYHPIEFHHGDCVGADEDGHNIVNIFNYAKIVVHPPIDPKLRAFCMIDPTRGDEIREEKDYLDRNKDIVNETELLIAFPNNDVTHRGPGGGGTWATVRYARSVGKKVIVVYKNGNLDILEDL